MTRSAIVPQILVATAISCSAETAIRGILLEDSSGPSARASGQMFLLVSGRTKEYLYESREVLKFANTRCYRPGSIWTLNVSSTALETVIVSGHCDGHVDPEIFAAGRVVADFLKAIARANIQSAERMYRPDHGSSAAKHKFRSAVGRLDLSMYLTHGGPGCIAITKVRRPYFEVTATSNCYIDIDTSPAAELVFGVFAASRGSQITSVSVRSGSNAATPLFQ